jgi:hypothetical protein
MGWYARLRRGAAVLYLDDRDGLTLGLDFRPPGRSFDGGSRAWALSVRSTGTSNAQCESQLAALSAFLERAGDVNEPTYLEWRSSDNYDYQPLYGQAGAFRKVEIIGSESYEFWEQYAAGNARTRVIYAYPVLTVSGYTLGQEQRLASAYGGVLEDVIGAPDGRSRGLLVPVSLTNYFTNPIFGHSTWGTGWAAAAGVTAELVKDPAYLLPGHSWPVVRVTRTGAGTAYNQTINLASTADFVISCYARKEDGSLINTATDCSLIYNVNVGGDVAPVGGGWYRIQKIVTGINAAVAAGLNVFAGKTVYVTGFQLESSFDNYATPLMYGNLPGCTWGGTAHNSATTRTAARVYVPTGEIAQPSEGTIRVVWKSPVSMASYGFGGTFFEDGNAALQGYIDPATNTLRMRDNAGHIATLADTFAANEIMVLHFRWGPNGVQIIKNGVGGTAAPFTTAALGTYLYIGSNSAVTMPIGGTILGFTAFNREMADAEIAADAAEYLAAAQGPDGLGARIDWVPYLWNIDGDGVLDNCDDSDQHNWALCAGIPGDIPADTTIQVQVAAAVTKSALWIGNTPHKLDTLGQAITSGISPYYYESSGTATAATDSGSAVSVTAVNTAIVSYPMAGRDGSKLGPTHFFARITDAGANLAIAPAFSLGVTTAFTGQPHYITADATRRLFYAGELDTDTGKVPLLRDDLTRDYSYALLAARTVAGAANLTLDFYMVVPGQLCKLERTGTNIDQTIRFSGKKALSVTNATTTVLSESINVTGDEIRFEPDRLNLLRYIYGNHAEAHVIADTGTFICWVVPRWSH